MATYKDASEKTTYNPAAARIKPLLTKGAVRPSKPKAVVGEVAWTFRGDPESAAAKLEKAGILGSVINTAYQPRFMWIPVSQLNPLDTQRDTAEAWVSKRLIEQRGFDMLACGALSVILDPDDGKYYVYDGCGRLAQAQVNGNPKELPCLVFDVTKKVAAYYFAYNQDKGRRGLSKEVIFVNQVYNEQSEAVVWEHRLKQLGMYIKGATDYPVPYPQDTTAVECKYHSLVGGYKLASGDLNLMREARDIIVDAWGTEELIKPGIYWGMIVFLNDYPEARDPTKAGYKEFRAFIKASAGMKCHYNQAQTWNQLGGNKTNYRAASVALGMVRDFRDFPKFKTEATYSDYGKMSKIYNEKRIQKLIPQDPAKGDDYE